MGKLTRQDSTIFRKWFKEMAMLRGISVIYKYPIDMSFSLYAEEDPRGFSEDIPMNIIFEENPKMSTLRKYGWISEVPEDKPYIAQLPFDAKNLCKGCRIIIPSPFPLSPGRTFVITEITGNLEFPDNWVCKLAPVFHDKPKQPSNYEDTNYNFIKTKK
jgi:hypothetical protein